jgi:hypothetical protein
MRTELPKDVSFFTANVMLHAVALGCVDDPDAVACATSPWNGVGDRRA